MTGTLERGDGNQIAFMPYIETDIGLIPDLSCSDTITTVQYTRQDAISEKAILPLEFHLSTGTTRWISKKGVNQKADISEADKKNVSNAIFTALRTEFAWSLLDSTITNWNEYRHNFCKYSKLLIVTANYEIAQNTLMRLKQKYNFKSKIATSHESIEAQKAIRDFKIGSIDILVTIAMAYEGLDVPEISHICCLTNIRSTPWLIQMCGRAVRINKNAGSYESQIGYIFAPDDINLKSVVEQIKTEQLGIIKTKQSQQQQLSSKKSSDRIEIVPIASTHGDSRILNIDNNNNITHRTHHLSIYGETQSEKEKKLRKKIDTHVKKYSFANRFNPHIINFKIKSFFDKKREDMTLEELKKVLKHIKIIYPISEIRGTGYKRVPTKAVPYNYENTIL